jgi:hypothetical protein
MLRIDSSLSLLLLLLLFFIGRQTNTSSLAIILFVLFFIAPPFFCETGRFVQILANQIPDVYGDPAQKRQKTRKNSKKVAAVGFSQSPLHIIKRDW